MIVTDKTRQDNALFGVLYHLTLPGISCASARDFFAGEILVQEFFGFCSKP